MKREIIAGTVLLLLLVAVLFNSFFISRLTGNIISIVDEAADAADAGKWETSVEKATEAIKLWNMSDKYTHIILNHDEIGMLSDSLYELLEEIHAGNSGTVTSAARMVRTRLEDVAKMESMSPGSIF